MLVLKSLGKLTSGYLWSTIKDCWVSKMPLYSSLSRVHSKLEGIGLLCPRDVREMPLRTDGRRNYFQNVLLKVIRFLLSLQIYEFLYPATGSVVSSEELNLGTWWLNLSMHLVLGDISRFQGIIWCPCWTYTKICQFFPCNVHPQEGRSF